MLNPGQPNRGRVNGDRDRLSAATRPSRLESTLNLGVREIVWRTAHMVGLHQKRKLRTGAMSVRVSQSQVCNFTTSVEISDDH